MALNPVPEPTPAGVVPVTLPSGRLELRIDHSLRPLDELLEFAVRRNPRRGFLFVSRVLGKHIPVDPAVAAATHAELAAALPPLSRPHFIGLAETATALGEGVSRAWEALTGQPGTFQHTTRYLTRHSLLLRFDEPHSHAPAHLLYDPGEAARSARELVLVDDELSTGTTLHNLADAWLTRHPHLERVVLVCLTDWSGHHRQTWADFPRPVEVVSLLRGSFRFEANPAWQAPSLPALTGNGQDKTARLPARGARFGTPGEPVAGVPHTDPGDRLLVLGLGEFQFPAFELARTLAPRVASCHWSATTRSPVLPGLAIRHSLSFTDSVGDGMPNYLYNVDPGAYTRILVGYEGGCLPDGALMAQLGPHAQAVKLA